MTYVLAFHSALKRSLYDRSGLAFRSTGFIAILVVYATIWRTATHGNTIHGYSYKDLVWYMLGTEIAMFSLHMSRIEEIGEDIASGMLEMEMLRPIPTLGIRLASEIGTSSGRLFTLWIIGPVLAFLLAGSPPSAASLLWLIPVSLISIACNSAGMYVVASCAFWIRDTKAAWLLYQKAVFVLGGMMFPIAFLPHVLTMIGQWLPFWTMAQVNGQAAIGRFPLYLLVAQCAWLGVLTGAASLLFAVGEQRLQAGVS